MAKNPLITDNVRELIATAYLENPDYRAKEIKREVEIRLHETNPRAKPDWPGLSAVQKELTKIRGRYHELIEHEEENVWSLFSYFHFEVPPDALPAVLQVWLSARKDDKMPVTNREVKWVVRLHKVIKDVKKLKNTAKSLAFSELLGEILHLGMMGHPGRPLTLIEDMTGEEFSEKEARRITQAHLPENYHRGQAQRHIKDVEQSFAQLKAEQEAQDERSHSQEVQE